MLGRIEMTKRTIVIIVVVLGLVAAGATLAWYRTDRALLGIHRAMVAGLPTIGNVNRAGSSVINIKAVGDIMLGRNVENKMKANGADYPFALMTEWLKKSDLTIANLEGPIVTNHQQTPSGSLSFSFSSSVAPVIAKSGIDLVSQANNHGTDRGETGWQQTQSYLEKSGVGYFGHPIKIGDASVWSDTVQGQRLTIVGFSAVFSFDDAAALQLIDRLRKDKSTYLIVFIHWGTEYKTVNSVRQTQLGYAFIDHGVDLVIGHHPHVVQNIEQYRGHLIAYSLGNFIFDQYFSTDTQESLGLDLNLNATQLVMKLVPIELPKSQPRLMTGDQRTTWLASLAKRSSADLQAQITAGKITVNR